MKHFLQRTKKFNALTELKQFESTNKQEEIIFPAHHRIKCVNTGNKCYILRAYEGAQEMVILVRMDRNLIKYVLFDIQESSEIARELLQLNTLTESEVLVFDGRNNDSGVEEDAFILSDENAEDGQGEMVKNGQNIYY